MDISIIIVSYNVKYYLEQTILSVISSAKNITIEIFVVDNNSSDGSIEYIKSCFPKTEFPYLHFIENHSNLGFGRANNLALKYAQGDYILFLNPDTILSEETLSECLKFAKQHQNLGGLGVEMLQDNGQFAKESRRGLPTPWVAFCKMSGLGNLFPKSKIFGRYYLSFQPKEMNQEIEIISGAFMMLSSKGILATKGFDPRFFMYGEDIDISFRLIQVGLKNYYVNTPILHYKGESTHKNSFKYVHVFYEAMLIFFKKHYPNISKILYLPVMFAIILQAFLTLISQQYYSLKNYLFPFSETSPIKMLYIGTQEKILEEASLKWDLNISYKSSLPTLDEIKFMDFIIFDTSNYTYSEILKYLKYSHHRQQLGLFYPDKKLLITSTQIYTCKS